MPHRFRIPAFPTHNTSILLPEADSHGDAENARCTCGVAPTSANRECGIGNAQCGRESAKKPSIRKKVSPYIVGDTF